MNKFTKDNLKKDGQYLVFGDERRFVARFKYNGPFTMSKFRKELIASHTPDSYFYALDRGIAPLNILRNVNPLWYSLTLEAYKNRF
jgi:hypothetical protein